MFTGIIESTGVIKEVIVSGTNKTFWIESQISDQLIVDQSVSHNGACLTIEEVIDKNHRVTAIEETMKKTNLNDWKPGSIINLERCLQLSSRLDGHLVQGHVDTTGRCIAIKEKKGSREYTFQFPKKFAELVIEKGSVCVNGISLTAFNVKKKCFTAAIIPYTLEYTNMKELKKKDAINLEFDVIGKYLLRSLSLKEQ